MKTEILKHDGKNYLERFTTDDATECFMLIGVRKAKTGLYDWHVTITSADNGLAVLHLPTKTIEDANSFVFEMVHQHEEVYAWGKDNG